MAADERKTAIRAAVSVVGLGAMGSAVAGAFLEAGHPTTVWNRSSGKADPLVENGAVRAATVGEAFGASPLVLLCVLNDSAARETLAPLGAREATGRVLANLTTGTPEQARRMAAWAEERGLGYLDGGVLGDPGQVGTPAARFYYSGRRDAFEAHHRTLEVLGESTSYHGDDAGLASVYLMALVGLSYEIWVSYLNTLALLGAEGVGAAAFAPAATEVLGPTLGLLEEFARAADEGDYPPAAGPLRTHAPLMDDLIDGWRARGAPVDRLRQVRDLVDRRVAEGRGEEGFSSLIEAIRERSASA
jgi:3-hydroxyisobutyrate dehydrogenase-like beta-hydroxyacid dehydrogenase